MESLDEWSPTRPSEYDASKPTAFEGFQQSAFEGFQESIEDFMRRIDSPEVQKLVSRVSWDLDPWKDGISLEMVERMYCIPEAHPSFRFQASHLTWATL